MNADAIAAGLSVLRPEAAAAAAGRVMLLRIDFLARARRDFAFETTLASRSFAPRLKRLRRSGYRSHLAFLSLPTPDAAVARVAERVRMGGHDVPETTVRRRFVAGLRNLITLYDDAVDSWTVLDNSKREARLVASRPGSGPLQVFDRVAWESLMEYAR